MRLGISFSPAHSSPSEWAEKLYNMSCRSAVFPCNWDESEKRIDEYVKAAKDYDLCIAELGAWSNPMSSKPEERKKIIRHCQEQLRLAEYIKAKCCVNIAGSCGTKWDGGYPENYSADTYRKIVDTTCEIIDAVNPQNTFYTLEPMPWMMPDGPDEYLKLINDINRKGFAVHMDIVNMISSPRRYFFNTEFIKTCFKKLAPYTKSCHVKDIMLEPFLTFNLKEKNCGGGTLDIVSYAREAEKADPDMPFIIEHLSKEEEYIDSIAYIKNLLAENKD